MAGELEALATGLGYLEAPRIDDHGNLYFSDVILGGVYKRAPNGTITTVLADRQSVGGMALNRDGAIVTSGLGGVFYFHEQTGVQRPIFTEYDGKPIDTTNDVQPDGKGGLYVGLIDAAAMHANRPMKGCPLVRLDPDGTVTRMWDGIVMTNGMGLSPDGKRLYHNESGVGIWAYERAADGSFATRRLVAPVNDCDGMAVDSEEGIWIARFGSGQVLRFRPDGSLERTVPIPIKQVLSLTFGGKDLRDLYIVTASDFWDHTSRIGTIYRMRSDIPGQKTPLTDF